MLHAAQNLQPKNERGLAYWMTQVVEEAKNARAGFEADPVHDLRVAIRRCRSIAEGFLVLDPHPAWKRMRKAARPVFQALGELRDVQVLLEWVDKLSGPEDPVHAKLVGQAKSREQELKRIAEARLDEFDLNEWAELTKVLEVRAQQLPVGGEVFQVMALERWLRARALQATALRNRSKISMHELRIGVKKFRYIVENFLPDLHEAWSKELKRMQDLLGEIHDLDVLWNTAKTIHAFANPEQRDHWLQMIRRERDQRLSTFREKALGKQSVWHIWRKGLPDGEALRAAIQKNFETWAFFRDPDVSHTHRVLNASLPIFDRLLADGIIQNTEIEKVPARDILIAAVFTHGVNGGGKGKRHKQVVRLLRKVEPPPGWSANHINIVSLVARYHRGALPSESQKAFATLNQQHKVVVRLLAGILRLADSFDHSHQGTVQRIRAIKSNGCLTIRAVGHRTDSPEAAFISSARHLLETVINLPILVRGDDAVTAE